MHCQAASPTDHIWQLPATRLIHMLVRCADVEPTNAGVQYVGPLVSLLEEGFDLEAAKVALSEAANDVGDARALLLQKEAQSADWLWAGRADGGLVLESFSLRSVKAEGAGRWHDLKADVAKGDSETVERQAGLIVVADDDDDEYNNRDP